MTVSSSHTRTPAVTGCVPGAADNSGKLASTIASTTAANATHWTVHLFFAIRFVNPSNRESIRYHYPFQARTEAGGEPAIDPLQEQNLGRRPDWRVVACKGQRAGLPVHPETDHRVGPLITRIEKLTAGVD